MTFRDLPWKTLAPILALSLVLQLLATANVKLLPDYDEAIYWDVSRNCHNTGLFLRSQEHGELFFDHPPLYLYSASPIFLFTESMDGFRFVSSLFSLVLVVLTALAAGRLLGADAVLPSAALLALNPMLLFYGNSGYQDVPFCVPVLGAYLAAFAGMPVVTGLLLGAACLVKYFAGGFAGCVTLYFYLSRPDGKYASRKFVATFLAVAVVWPIVGIALDTHGFDAKLAYWNRFLTMKSNTAFAHHPVAPIGKYLQSVFDRFTALHALVLMVGLGFHIRRARALAPELGLVLFTAVSYVGTLLCAFALRTDRYLVESLPFLAILASGALLEVKPRLRAATLVVVCGVSLFVLMPGMTRLPLLARPQYTPDVYAFQSSVKEAAAFAADHLDPKGILLVDWNGPRLGYFSRHNYRVLFWVETLEEIVARIDACKVLVRDHESGKWFLPYLDESQLARLDRKLEAEFEYRDFGKVRVYVRHAAVPPRPSTSATHDAK